MNYCDVYNEYQKKYNYYHSVTSNLDAKLQEKKKLDMSLEYAEHMRDESHNAYVIADSNYLRDETSYQRASTAYEQGKNPRKEQNKAALKEYEKELRLALDNRSVNPYGNLIEKDRETATIEMTKQTFLKKREQYVSRRSTEIRLKLNDCKTKLDVYLQNPQTITQESILHNSHYKRLFNDVTRKIENIDTYLENSAIKKHTLSSDIKKILSTENPGPLDNVNSRNDLFDVIKNIKTPTSFNLPVEEEDTQVLVDRAKREGRVKIAGICNGILFSIIGFLIFLKINPIDNLLPHIIHGGLLSAPAGFFRFLIVWCINLILETTIFYIAKALVEETPIALLFYKEQSKVEKGLQYYYNYINANKPAFLSLYHFWVAAKYAYEEELSSNIDECNCHLGTIEKEAEYKQIVSEEEKELQRIRNARDLQKRKFLEDLQKKRDCLKEADEIRIKTLKTTYDQAEKNLIDSKRRKASSLSESQKRLKDYLEITSKADLLGQEISALQEEELSTLKILKEGTNNIFNIDYKTSSIYAMATPEGLNAVKGTLSDKLFLINGKKDQNNLAVLTEIPLKCMPTVMLYDKKELLTPNLGKELSEFIKWIIDGLLRINPILIFDDSRINIIDPVTSGLVFHDVTSFTNVKIYSSNSELAEFTHDITNHMNMITQSCIDLHQPVDIKAVNIEKAKRNSETDFPVYNTQDMREQYCTYNVSLFILPQETKEKKSSINIINDELKRYFRNCAEFGLLPIFIVDKETFNLDTPGPTIDSLKEIVLNDCIFTINGVGQRSNKTLAIHQGQ